MVKSGISVTMKTNEFYSESTVLQGERKYIYYCHRWPGNPGLWNHALDSFINEDIFHDDEISHPQQIGN